MNSIELFGTRRRTQVLEAVCLLEETHAREMATLLGVPVRTIQRIIEKLEIEGVVVGRVVGRERRLTLNRRYFGYEDLRQLLLKLAMRDHEVDDLVSKFRRRPRQKGKEL